MTAVVHSVDGRHSGDIISAPGRGRDRLDRLVPVVLGCIVLLAWSTVSPAGYWADEGITLDIAALPLTEIPSALRLDVSPPFYYLVLHCWMTLFGSSEMATNGLSLVAGLLAIGVAWRLGKVVAGARLGILLSLIVAASPRFFLNTTETRMYTFAILLGLLALLGWWRCLVLGQRSGPPRWVCSWAATALTHNYGLALAGARVVAGSHRAWATSDKDAATSLLTAVVVAFLCYVPWLPSLSVYNCRTTPPRGSRRRLCPTSR